MKKFGERVRYLRIKKGFSSQIDLANKIGTDRTYVGGIERGERNPTFEILEKLAKVLETTMSDLLKFDPALNTLQVTRCGYSMTRKTNKKTDPRGRFFYLSFKKWY